MLVEPTFQNDFEVVIGLVGAIGTNLELVSTAISEKLSGVGYSAEEVRLSSLMKVDAAQISSKGYYEAAMDRGDALREKYRSGDLVAALAVVEMMTRRAGADRERRHAFVLRSLKHPEEIELLRSTYRSRFVAVGVYESKEERGRHLNGLLEDEDPGAKDRPGRVAHLIDRDEVDTNNPFGQNVRDAFAASDYFLTMGPSLDDEVRRMIGLLFGEPFLTPTRDEVGMFVAYAASLRSADPGRQVGAVIATPEGELLAAGSNEVPRAGGGEYWVGDEADGRDFKIGHDHNKRQTRRSVREFIDALGLDNLLSDELMKMSSEDRVKRIFDSPSADLRGTRIMSLIEFGRIVHAEMSAISQAARSTISVKGATIFTTAFPCHMCMRLIIASGIARIVYVDPYPKSLAMDMYADSVAHGEEDGLVAVEAFRGASWSIYPKVFSATNRKRKPDGAFVAVDRTTLRMRLAELEPLLNAQTLEDQVPVAMSAVEDTFEDVKEGDGNA